MKYFLPILFLLIFSCQKELSSPESVTESFIIHLSDGNCSDAMKLCVDDSKNNVQSYIDAGCNEYETELIKIECKIEKKNAVCCCHEVRDNRKYYFEYKLRKLGGEWKISSYKKNMMGNYDKCKDWQ